MVGDYSGLSTLYIYIVVPKLVHKRHGIVKTKQLIRGMIWFPGIHAAVQEKIKRYLPYQAATDTKQKEPLLPT